VRHLRKHHLALICVLYTALVTGLLLSAERSRFFQGVWRWEMQFRDFMARHGQKNPADPSLVFVGIDNDSVSMEEVDLQSLYADVPRDSSDYRALTLMSQHWPWSREVHAMLLDKLCAAGARVVVFDLLFLKPALGDDPFRAALDRHRDRVVIGSNFVQQALPDGMSAWEHTLPVPALVPQSNPLDPRVAYTNFWIDGADEKIRKARFRVTLEGQKGIRSNPKSEVFLSVAARAVTQAGLGGLVPGAPDVDWPFRFTAAPGEGFRPRPVYQLFVPKYWAANFGNGAAFRDKIVVVGPVGDWQHDEHDTPLGTMVGAELHLNAINALLHGSFLKEAPLLADVLLIVCSGLVAWFMMVLGAKPLLQASFALLGNAMWLLLTVTAFNYFHFLAVFVMPLLAFDLSMGTGLIYEFVAERLDRIRTRRFFERYVSKDVVRELLDNRKGALHVLGGARRPVTVLFSDLRGFTSLTENSDPEALVAQLNEYFKAMVRVVFAHHGTLDKFMGDGLMAHWGSIVSHGAYLDARNALRAALEMREVFAKLNAHWQSRGLPTLQFGVGLNSGEAIVGNMGCDEKMEVSLMGDAVNLASRIEGTTKHYHVDILVGGPVAELVGDKFVLRTVDTVRVKGKTASVEVFAVLSERTAETVVPEWLEVYEEAVRCYRVRRFVKAAELCRHAAQLNGGDFLIEEYLRRAESMALNPPSPGWSGIQIMDQK